MIANNNNNSNNAATSSAKQAVFSYTNAVSLQKSAQKWTESKGSIVYC